MAPRLAPAAIGFENPKIRSSAIGLILGLVSIVCSCAHEGAGSPGDAYDLIITNARIVDGTGNPWFWGDVGIRGDRIARVGQLDGRHATREIDAQRRGTKSDR